MNRTTRYLMSCLVLMTANAAFAEDEAELVEKVAVRNRLFSVAGRWELGGNVGFSLLSRLTEHYNLNLSVAVNPVDWFGVELRGGYAISRHTSLADQIQTDFFNGNSTTSTTKKVRDAADLWELTAHGVIGARFQPVYGKINLMSELPIHFQFYLWVGGGVGLLKRESMVECADRAACVSYLGDRSQPTAFLAENKVSPLVSVALGFRFFIAQHHSVKIEARDWSYLDSYKINITRLCQPNIRGCATAPDGTNDPSAGITNLVQFDLGYSFIF